MGTPPNPQPPYPVNDLEQGSQDQPLFVGPGTAWQDWKLFFDWLKDNYDDVGKTIAAVEQSSGINNKVIATLIAVAQWAIVHLAEAEMAIDEVWVKAEAAAYTHAVPYLESAGATEAAVALQILLKAMAGAPAANVEFGGGDMARVAQQMFNELVQPFTLMKGAADPTVVGSGLYNQQYLLAKSMNMALQEWIVSQLGDHLGMGFFKTLRPFLGILDRSINPSNVVRQSMESSYSFLLKAPLTRDLNRSYPIKNLGITAWAKLFVRGAVDLNTYLDKCLDFGLDNTQAQQLVLESSKLLTRGDVAELLKLGYITQDDARRLLLQQGFQSESADAILYLDTHARYYTIAERVGNAAVAAWKKDYIDQARLEQILQQTGFTQDEITLLEVEGEFTKSYIDGKPLTYTEVKNLFSENIIGIGDVITYLQDQGYNPDNVMRLVLLDFTAAEERQLQRQRLEAQLRVNSEQQKVLAAADARRNETALAQVRMDLAAELKREADAYGQIASKPGIIALLGGLP